MSLRKIIIGIVSVSILLIWTGGALAIPQKITYQGKLTDSSGNPITGSKSIVFTIYDAASDGSDLWTETRSVSVYKGIYNIILGEDTAIGTSVFNGDERWLGIKVESDSEMTPRLKIVSAGNAYRAYNAENLDGKDSAEFIQLGSTTQQSTTAAYGVWVKGDTAGGLFEATAMTGAGIWAKGYYGGYFEGTGAGPGVYATSSTGLASLFEGDVKVTGDLTVEGGTIYGDGSGLTNITGITTDADTVDGKHAANFVQLSPASPQSGIIDLTTSTGSSQIIQTGTTDPVAAVVLFNSDSSETALEVLNKGFGKGVAVVSEKGMGVYGKGPVAGGSFESTGAGPGVYVKAGSGLAGKFEGDVKVTGDLTVTGTIDATAQSIEIWNHTPASSSEAGSVGLISYDSDYFYIWIAADHVKRAALSDW